MHTSNIQNILVISVHPDDEALGCAGTLLKFAKQGAQIHWAIITDARTEYGFSEEFVKKRKEEITTVSKMLDCKKVINLGLKPAHVCSSDFSHIIQTVGSFIKDNKIDTIFCVNRSDAHSDHRVSFDACASFLKSFRYPTVKNFFSYECISETEFAPPLPEKVFLPNFYVDISLFMEKKLEIIKVYQSELGEHPFPRSIKGIIAQATLRGAYSNYTYAEAFQALKICAD